MIATFVSYTLNFAPSGWLCDILYAIFAQKRENVVIFDENLARES